MKAILAALLLCCVVAPAAARDDGRFANSPLKSWFDKLSSGKGLCCSFADGRRIENPDWGTEPYATAEGNSDGPRVRYWVRIDGQKIPVPPDAVVTEPNRAGAAYVWPYQDADGKTQIRCFLRGTES